MRDFGYSEIDWEAASPDNVKAVEAEYRLRLDGGYIAANELDQKARFMFTGLIGAATAVVSWAFSQDVEPYYELGLYSLAAIFVVASIFAALAFAPRSYRYPGATPPGLNVAIWRPLLLGGQPDLVRLSGVRIKEYARSIDLNEKSNDSRSWWLSSAMKCTVAAFPISALVVFFVWFYSPLSNAAGLALASPVLGLGLWFIIGGAVFAVTVVFVVRKLHGPSPSAEKHAG